MRLALTLACLLTPATLSAQRSVTRADAAAAAMHAQLSRRTADDADSLLKVAELRREVGDVSELDVRLAAVNAGQLENIALDDSLAALGVLLSLQLQMGLTGDAPVIALADSLIAPADSDQAARRCGE